MTVFYNGWDMNVSLIDVFLDKTAILRGFFIIFKLWEFLNVE